MCALLAADGEEYRRWFTPFEDDADAVTAEIAGAVRDRYWLVALDDEPAGLVLLRGLDAGFAAPAFGVYVAERFSGRGLGSLALAFAEAWCRVNGLPELMLTVHPENLHARRLYERSGFAFAGETSEAGNLVLRKPLAR